MSYDYREITDAIPITSIQLVTTVRRTYTVVITPEDCKRLLENNNNNRKLNINTVGRYASMMKQGQWDWVDGDMPLKFGTNGELMNGQHRLNAQISADVTGAYDIRTGIPSESFKVMDSGVNRKIADYFGARAGSKDVSALATKVMAVRNGYMSAHTASSLSTGNGHTHSVDKPLLLTEKRLQAPTRVEIVNYAQENYEMLYAYTRLGVSINSQNGRGGASNYAFALFMLGECGNDIKPFVNDYVHGDAACSVTKTTILKKLVDKNYKPKPQWYTGVTLMAFDYWTIGKGQKVIREPDVDARYKKAVVEYQTRPQLLEVID